MPPQNVARQFIPENRAITRGLPSSFQQMERPRPGVAQNVARGIFAPANVAEGIGQEAINNPFNFTLPETNLPQNANDNLFGVQTAQSEEFGLRVDGTRKGTGFLGVLNRPDGRVSTELSVGVFFNDKETLIPLLVPTLTQDEIDFLLSSEGSEGGIEVPEAILDKAVGHAKQRINDGRSPFLEEGEEINP